MRQTVAQLLGVLALYLDFGQLKHVVRHLLGLVSMLKEEEGKEEIKKEKQQQNDDCVKTADQETRVATKRPASVTPSASSGGGHAKANWMVVHSGLLGINYLLSTRKVSRALSF